MIRPGLWGNTLMTFSRQIAAKDRQEKAEHDARKALLANKPQV
jgi:hypothetical protein